MFSTNAYDEWVLGKRMSFFVLLVKNSKGVITLLCTHRVLGIWQVRVCTVITLSLSETCCFIFFFWIQNKDIIILFNIDPSIKEFCQLQHCSMDSARFARHDTNNMCISKHNSWVKHKHYVKPYKVHLKQTKNVENVENACWAYTLFSHVSAWNRTI